MNDALHALKTVADSARSLLEGRKRDLDDLDAHIARLQQMASPVRDAPLQKMGERRAELATELASAQRHLAEVERARDLVQRLVDDLAATADRAADAAAAREAKVHELRLLSMKREQELTTAVDEREHALTALRATDETRQREHVELRAAHDALQLEVTTLREVTLVSAEEAQRSAEALRAAHDAAAAAEGSLQSARAHAQSAADEARALREGADANEKELTALRASSAELTRAHAELLALRAAAAATTQELASLRESVAQRRDADAQHEAALTALHTEAEQLRAGLALLRDEGTRNKEERAKELAEARAESEKLRAQHADSVAQLAAARGESEQLRAEHAAQLAAARGESEQLRAEHAAQLAAARGESEQLRAEHTAQLAAARGESEQLCAEHGTQLAAARGEIEQLRAEHATHLAEARGDGDRLRAEVTHARDELRALQELVDLLTSTSTRPRTVTSSVTPPAGTPRPEFETITDPSDDKPRVKTAVFSKEAMREAAARDEALERGAAPVGVPADVPADAPVHDVDAARHDGVPAPPPFTDLPRPPGLPPPPPLAPDAARALADVDVRAPSVSEFVYRSGGRAPAQDIPLPSDKSPITDSGVAADDGARPHGDDAIAPPDTRVRATATLAVALFTHADDERFAKRMPTIATPIADIARDMSIDVDVATQRIWELVSVGLVEVE